MSKNPVFPYVMLKEEEIKAETIAENNEKVISSILNIISSSIQLIWEEKHKYRYSYWLFRLSWAALPKLADLAEIWAAKNLSKFWYVVKIWGLWT